MLKPTTATTVLLTIGLSLATLGCKRSSTPNPPVPPPTQCVVTGGWDAAVIENEDIVTWSLKGIRLVGDSAIGPGGLALGNMHNGELVFENWQGGMRSSPLTVQPVLVGASSYTYSGLCSQREVGLGVAALNYRKHLQG